MGRLVAEWVFGDTLKDLIYTVQKSDGTAFDLTGATVTLQGRRRSDVAAAISRNGTLSVTPTDGKATFSDLTNGLTLSSPREVFDCRLKVVKSGKTGWTDPFELAVVKWP